MTTRTGSIRAPSPRRIFLNGKADRIDLLEDGTFHGKPGQGRFLPRSRISV
jgi:hypothetical protein